MKRKFINLLTVILAFCLILSVVTACNGEEETSKPTEIKKLSASLLDGKVANLMGAEAFGILEKNTQIVLASSSSNRVLIEAEEKTQKKTEFIKETSNGYVDVHFHSKGNVNGYKDLNKKFSKHHHGGKECDKSECDEISDEITLEESSGKSSTIMSLDARINKLYNYKNFTFMSVSSAIEGEIQVLCKVYRTAVDTTTLMQIKNSYPTLVNIENHFNTNNSGWEFGYIQVPSTENSKGGYIPIKVNENETGYHTANYWSDDYNQSYIIDNNTGITYSLSQFPYIYSVDNGIIKIYDETAAGWFRYYKPVVSDSGINFEEIKLPTETEFVSSLPACASSSSVIIDKYGNMLFNSAGYLNKDLQVDEYGEKKYGNNVILALPNYEYYQYLLKNQSFGAYGELFASRYLKANRYKRGSDGRIYRVDFRGILGDVKVHVLDENCTWKQVDNSVNVTFDKFNGGICWWAGINKASIDSFRITKISNGYAYYSTACSSDGVNIWDLVVINNNLRELGDYTGVVKIPVNGPDSEKSHLLVYDNLLKKGVDLNRNYSIFLVGDTQVLYHVGNTLYIEDIETGKKSSVNTLDEKLLVGVDRNNLAFSINGETKYLNVLLSANAENLIESLSSDKIVIGGELDAYFKFVTQN